MKLNKDKLSKYIILAIVAMVIIILFIALSKSEQQEVFYKDFIHIFSSPRNLKHYILSFGALSAVAFITIYSLKPVLLIIPTSLFSILAGNIFGPWYGLTLSMVSSFLVATLAFFLAKKLGKNFVDRLMKGKAPEFDSNIEKHGLKVILLMRLSFIFPVDALSYAAGLTSMRYREFILGTVAGILPEMVAYSFIGESFEEAFSIKFFLPIIAIIFVAVISYCYYKSMKE